MGSEDEVQRSILPIPDKQHVGVTTYDAKDPDTKFPPIERLRPPQGAPNVLIVLLDDVGKEGGSPVSPDYGPAGNEFSGEVNWVQFDLEKDDNDHLISPDERFRVAMARQ